MSVFIDTNIWLRSVQPNHPMHEPATRQVAGLLKSAEPLVVTPQVLAEFWNAATRPQQHNGLGMSHAQAAEELTRMESFLFVLSESAEVYREWKRLVTAYRVTGVKTHDARIVAAMTVYGVRRILTFNADDFTRYREIDILCP